MTTFTEQAQKYIENSMLDLSGEEDFLPFLSIRNAKNEIAFVGMMMPEGPAAKDQVANMMTTMCVVHRGVEVAFASTSWMAVCESEDDAENGLPPSKRANRQEVAFLTVLDSEGKCEMHTAPIIRESNIVTIGVWDSSEGALASGRFADAISIGIGMAQKLPPDLVEYIDEEMEAGRGEGLIKRMMAMINEVRTGAENN